MKGAIKLVIRRSVGWAVRMAVRRPIGRYTLDQVLGALAANEMSVRHQNVELRFAAPNNLLYFRVNTFSTKEPETLEWIDAMPRGAVVWDIGANIGLYSCYAAKARGCQVIAFEPSVFNLELLARNIFLNGLVEQISIVPLPLSDALGVSSLNMTTTELGGAMSSFGQNFGYDGRPMQRQFEFRTLGVTMENAVGLLQLRPPDYIKLDVDGIEHLVLKGGAAILRQVKGVLIEINEDFAQQFGDSTRYLRESGLVLKEKRHAEVFDQLAMFKNTFNQIWHRPQAP